MRTMGEKLIEQGLLKGRAEDVLRILAARHIDVDERARKLILTCTDLPTLDQWFDRALTATRFSDLMASS